VTERQENVRDAFACRGTALAGRKVILIDDVATSGATLDACAGVLKEAGAESVRGLTLAREI
jgi:predicted amidophosphoribosyltransferase